MGTQSRLQLWPATIASERANVHTHQQTTTSYQQALAGTSANRQQPGTAQQHNSVRMRPPAGRAPHSGPAANSLTRLPTLGRHFDTTPERLLCTAASHINGQLQSKCGKPKGINQQTKYLCAPIKDTLTTHRRAPTRLLPASCGALRVSCCDKDSSKQVHTKEEDWPNQQLAHTAVT